MSENPHQTRLVAFYEKHAPEKLSQVDEILEKFKGKEEHMFEVLAKKYGSGGNALGIPTTNAKIFVGTWNVGDAAPADMKPFLLRIDGADLAVISLQECNYPVKGASSCEDDFFGKVTCHLPDYDVLVSTSMWTIRIIVLVKKTQAHRISNVRQSNEATGIGHVIANKGGIAVGLRFDASDLCFVGAHLAAHLEKVSARNSDVAEIIEGVSPKLGNEGIDILGCYHHVFWCGDLNYRVDWDFANVVEHSNKKDVAPLYQYDQLVEQMKLGKVFLGFSEPLPTFTPTYRFLRDTDPAAPRVYDEWKHRVPSWCDRVLHKGLGNSIDTAVRTAYDVEHDVRSSDHSPVFGMFDTKIRAVQGATATGRAVSSITISNLKCKGLVEADTFGLSDPWITFLCKPFSLPPKETKTKVQWKTLDPEWEGVFEFPFSAEGTLLSSILSEYLLCVLRDSDQVGADDPLGQVILPLDIFGLAGTDPFAPQEVELPVILHGERHGTLTATVQLKGQ